MGLREQAAADVQAVLEDQDGFGWEVEVTDPDGNTALLTGFTTDISQTIDPETGTLISGRLASLTLSIATLEDAGFDALPRNIAERDRKPWVVAFDDIRGKPHTFKVREAMPDRAVGVVVCILEGYEP